MAFSTQENLWSGHGTGHSNGRARRSKVVQSVVAVLLLLFGRWKHDCHTKASAMFTCAVALDCGVVGVDGIMRACCRPLRRCIDGMSSMHSFMRFILSLHQSPLLLSSRFISTTMRGMSHLRIDESVRNRFHPDATQIIFESAAGLVGWLSRGCVLVVNKSLAMIMYTAPSLPG